MKPDQNTKESKITRNPVIAIMGHIDHGKSTLLDYIRKTNIVDKEAGGITQHISAYEVEHPDKSGVLHTITFLDTPGHEAFQGIRVRGVNVADIAVLVVSAEDGVKPQTTEALKCIVAAGIPYVVAISKIDKPSANVDRAKQSLAENEIYIEGYGGTITAIPISAKTGEGINDLLDMLLLTAEVGDFTGNATEHASGVIIESNRDAKKGIGATLIIKNGTLNKGDFVAAGTSLAPVRGIEDFLGKRIDTAMFSSPVRITGWDSLVKVGSLFKTFESKTEAESYVESEKIKEKEMEKAQAKNGVPVEGTVLLPLILKADTAGSMEALLHEIEKIKTEGVEIKIIQSGVGTITENDVRAAGTDVTTMIVGFNTKVDGPADSLAERNGIAIKVFDIIYKLTEWIKETQVARKPKIQTEEVTGRSKIVRVFSKDKDKQIVGGKVETGILVVGESVKIMRRESEIGIGKVKGLQQQKEKADEVAEGKEFGALVESKIELAPGDRIESFKIVEK